MSSSEIDWPPSYTVKKHPRARSFKLRATKKHGLVITMPPRASMREIPELIEKHKSWITKHLLKLANQTTDELPEQIEFRILERVYKVLYIESRLHKRMSLYVRPTQEIAIMGDIKKKDTVKRLLLMWMKAEAKKILVPLLEMQSAKLNLPFESATIRDQQTVWGTCSAKKVINLNYKLVFPPGALAQHVMVHELCHTKHLNHSDRFWKLVSTFDADWEQHRRALRTAEEFMPRWL